ncbi:helicase, partial [Archaeoglobales archaeon]
MLKKAVEGLLSKILAEFSYHPFIAPYLNADIQPYIHQWEAIARLCVRNPIRVLVGDEIGLGKTITALVIAKYLEALDRVKRVLIVVPRVLVEQWRKELIRMGIPESKIWQLESDTIDFIKLQNFPEGYYIASMDLLKREERITEVVDVPWDLVIIDEVHKFGYKTERFWRIGKMMVEAKTDRNVVFLSATPHRGDPRDYISRLQLLDPYLTESWKELDRRQFYEATHGTLLFRRTKEDINKIYEGKEVFPPAKFYAGVVKAREDEAEFIERLVNFLRSKLIEFAHERGLIDERIIPLLTVLIFKRATSSPYAAMTTLERLLLRRVAPELTNELVDGVESFLDVGYEDYEYEKDPDEVFNEFLDATSPLLSERDRREIEELRDMAKSIMEKGDSKLNALITLLEDVMGKEDSKVIIFTEYKDTLDYIIKNLKKQHPEWSGSILRLSSEETRDKKLFGKIRNAFEKNPKARILIATDVVAEGVNLQVAHILINYEVPWSLVKLEQRIGRVWRLGQKKEVEAHTLFMANVADLAALNSMYQKLLSLRKAKLSPRPITGQEILLYADAGEFTKFPPSIVVEEKGKKKILKVTEAKAILTYLREDRAGLEKLIASILAAKQEVERELASKSVLYKPKTRSEVENTIGLLGFKDPSELFDLMKEIVK